VTTRIVHLVTGLDIGGAEMMLVRLLARIDRGRFDNHVISLLPPGELASSLRSAGIPVSSLAMRRGRPSPLALAHLVRRLRQLEPAVLQTWMYHADVLGTAAAALARVPSLVWNIRASDVDMSRYGWLSGLTRRVGAAWSRRPDAVIVNSEAGRVAHERLGFHPRRWVVIPNGIDVYEYRPDPARRSAMRAALEIADQEIVVGLVARFDPMKGHDTFLRAAGTVARAHPAARFVLVGAGAEPSNRELRALIDAAELGDRVALLGRRRDIPAVDAALDVAVMASTFGEGFPTAIAEAMACGVPSVVTEVGDAARLVGDTGWVVPPGDPAAMATAISAVLTLSAAERRDRGGAARARIVEQFSLDRATGQYEETYGSLRRV
jgi:glycosyltransferase involved in cell wall biosynthesis